MKIIAIETHLIRVPCDIGATPTAFVGVGWSSLDTLFVRVVTDEGLEGWGEGFGHACCPATRAVIDTQLAPAAPASFPALLPAPSTPRLFLFKYSWLTLCLINL